MTKIIYVDPDKGHDANTGLHPMRAKQTVQGALLATPTHVLLRQASRITTPLVLKTNGIAYGVYSLETEENKAPVIDTPKGTTALTLSGNDNIIDGWATANADIHVWLTAGEKGISYKGNRLLNMQADRFAQAFKIQSCDTVIQRTRVKSGRMLRDTGQKSDTGASGFTVWKEADYACANTLIEDCTTEDCYAYASAFPSKPDGSDVEAFGGIDGLTVRRHRSKNSGTFMEVGGTTARHETARNIVVELCEVVRPMARCLFVNPLNGGFAVGIEGIVFARNTLIADDDDASPFYIGAGHGSMKGKLRVDQNIVVASSQIMNAAEGTDWQSIERRRNVYWRTDADNAGIPLVNGDEFRNPNFNDPLHGDYRLIRGDERALDLGALGSA
jgi:hypothetical protein